MSKSTKSASPAEVRAWGAENGFTVGTRGKFNAGLIEAFNKAHRTKFAYRAFKPTVTVQAGRIRANVNIGEARALLAASGVTVGARGRLSKENLTQAVLLARQPKATVEA